MNKDKNPVIEKILNLTLEILCLLTGEDYMVVKKQRKNVTDSNSSFITDGFCRNQSSIMEPSLNSPMHKDKITMMELPNKVLHLPTAEVPVRCEDVAVYLSMEEWQYLEEHKENYEDLMKLNHQPLISVGSDNAAPDSVTRKESDSELSGTVQDPWERFHHNTDEASVGIDSTYQLVEPIRNRQKGHLNTHESVNFGPISWRTEICYLHKSVPVTAKSVAVGRHASHQELWHA
ncbi:gastrula zinc finger protein XlCGF53.1-like [Rhinophrynus dorsalis]